MKHALPDDFVNTMGRLAIATDECGDVKPPVVPLAA
jgi:hypothetical protein